MGVVSIDAPVARTTSAAARVLPFMQRRASGEPLLEPMAVSFQLAVLAYLRTIQ
jgi:hypothetical protein